MMANRWGRPGRQELSVWCTPLQRRHLVNLAGPARVACCGGPLMLPGPWSWKMTTKVASCLPSHSVRRAHFSPLLLTASLFLPGT